MPTLKDLVFDDERCKREVVFTALKGEGFAYFRWHILMGYYSDCRGWNDGRMCRYNWETGNRSYR